MEYEEFLECVKKQAEENIGERGCVSINHVIKNNGCELDGLVIMEKDSNISPTIYLNDFYEYYKNGENIEDIICEIIRIYSENKGKVNIDPKYFSDFNNIKDKIAYKVINYDRNRKLLKNIPHKKVLDLAVVYYCIVEQMKDSNATALIYNSHLLSWKVTEEDVHNAAIENTPELLKSSLRPISDIIKDMANNHSEIYKEDNCVIENCDENIDMEYDNATNEMFVLTNESKLNGAACILYDDVLNDFAKKIQRDLYILPSSVHEVILLPKCAAYLKEDLEQMVHEVNADGVSPDEILSDKVYIFNRESGMLTM